MVGGGLDYEGEMAAAKLRMKLEQEAGSLAETQRLRREEAKEQLLGRLAVLILVAVILAAVYLLD